MVKFPLKVLKPIRSHLEEEKRKLEKRKRELSKEDPFMDKERLLDNASDSDAAEKVGHERVSTLKKEIDRTLVKVRKALTRIKIGKYGLCAKCGKMIDTDRLAIDPTAELCIDCAKKEKK